MTTPFVPAARFAALTPVYDLACRLIGLGTRFRAFERGLLDDAAPAAVLEVGCGTGELLVELVRRHPGAEVVGLDPDPAALGIARQKLEGAGLPAKLDLGSAMALPYPDASFDLVVSSLMLHHLDTSNKLGMLRECGRVLTERGQLLLVDFGQPRNRIARWLTWPLRFRIFEEQGDNFRGRVPGLMTAAELAFEEVGTYGPVIVAYRARANRRPRPT